MSGAASHVNLRLPQRQESAGEGPTDLAERIRAGDREAEAEPCERSSNGKWRIAGNLRSPSEGPRRHRLLFPVAAAQSTSTSLSRHTPARSLEGQLLFRTPAYFRDNEDAVGGDEHEGTSKFQPEGGLVVHNQTQGTTLSVPMAFESSIRAYEIFVYRTSLTLSANLADDCRSVICVEAMNVKSLCERIRSELPRTAKFTARPVEYYHPAQVCNPRWACPIKSRPPNSTDGLPNASIDSCSP